MIVWPVLARELRLRARTSATYWLRLAVVLIGAAACLPQFAWSAATLTPSALGRSIFDGTIIAAFLVACCGFILTIDAVSRERHDQTLELLLLTRVKIWDVLAGKLGASGFAGLFGIVAFLPVLMIPVLAGGLTLAEILRKGLVLLNTLFFSLAVGLWASAARRRWLRVIGMVFVVFILPLFFDDTMAAPLKVSPIRTLVLAGDSAYRRDYPDYWISLIVVNLLGCALFFWTGAAVRNSTSQNGELADDFANSSALPYRNAWPRARQIIVRPIELLVRRQPGIKAEIWGFAALEIGYYGFSWLLFGNMAPALAIYLIWPIWIFASLASDSLLAHAAGRFFLQGRRSGALELLMTTPLGAREILSGQWRALRELLRWPVIVGLGGLCCQLIAEYNSFPGELPGSVYLISAGLSVTASLAGIGAVCSVAMWLAFRGYRLMVVITRAAAIGTVIPGAFRAILSLLTDSRLSVSFAEWPWFIKSWAEELVIGIYYFWLLQFARKRLAALVKGSDQGLT